MDIYIYRFSLVCVSFYVIKKQSSTQTTSSSSSQLISSLAIIVASLDSQIASYDVSALLIHPSTSTSISTSTLTANASLWHFHLVGNYKGGFILGKNSKLLSMPLDENPAIKKGLLIVFYKRALYKIDKNKHI